MNMRSKLVHSWEKSDLYVLFSKKKTFNFKNPDRLKNVVKMSDWKKNPWLSTLHAVRSACISDQIIAASENTVSGRITFIFFLSSQANSTTATFFTDVLYHLFFFFTH